MSTPTLKLTETHRGFALANFTDLYGAECSIQKSSLAELDAIWLGVDRDQNGKECSRMHLTQGMALALLPLLRRFVRTGELYDVNEASK